MVVIVRIEQTNKQITRQTNGQINKRKLNYVLIKFTEFTFSVLACFSHRSLGMSKEKQY